MISFAMEIIWLPSILAYDNLYSRDGTLPDNVGVSRLNEGGTLSEIILVQHAHKPCDMCILKSHIPCGMNFFLLLHIH